MRTTSTLVVVVMLICMTAIGTMAQDFAGPRLDGTVTLRSGQTISGLILTAQLGIVDGAEIGSRLRDGGYIAVRVNGQEQRVQATDIASVDVEWSQTGTAEDPKWKITALDVTTRDGQSFAGTPAWLVHATSLIVEEADGTQKKIYAFPMAGSNFSPDNLLASLTFGPAIAPVIETPAVQEPVTEEPVTEPAAPVATEPLDTPTAPVTDEPATPAVPDTPVEQPAEPVATVEPATAAPEQNGAPETAMTVTALPTVEHVPEGSVFASGQPAVVTFEVINPETGNPMQVRFLIVPLPAQ